MQDHGTRVPGVQLYETKAHALGDVAVRESSKAQAWGQ
jgi:hypothetical protein